MGYGMLFVFNGSLVLKIDKSPAGHGDALRLQST